MQRLEKAGIGYDYLPDIERQGIGEALSAGYSAIVIRSKTHLDKELLQNAPFLKLIARGGAGMDNVDEAFAISRGIHCLNAGEANANAVGEHALGMLLGLLHNISKSHAEIKQRIWDREGNRGTELGGKTVGIVGYGNTGTAVAEKLSGFNVKILAYDKYKKGFGNERVKEVEMEEIFRYADILTLHIPLDSHTKHIVNSDYIQSFVRNIVLMNLSRGGVVCTKDVCEALESGKLSGYCADVLENENPLRMSVSENEWFEKLIKRENVILTPHVAGWSVESYVRISEVLAASIISERARILDERKL